MQKILGIIPATMLGIIQRQTAVGQYSECYMSGSPRPPGGKCMPNTTGSPRPPSEMCMSNMTGSPVVPAWQKKCMPDTTGSPRPPDEICMPNTTGSPRPPGEMCMPHTTGSPRPPSEMCTAGRVVLASSTECPRATSRHFMFQSDPKVTQKQPKCVPKVTQKRQW